jgi:hypothetical protein
VALIHLQRGVVPPSRDRQGAVSQTICAAQSTAVTEPLLNRAVAKPQAYIKIKTV